LRPSGRHQSRSRTLNGANTALVEQAPSPSDEAQALAAVIDLRGGTVSARKLAAAVGHSEGWVRTRLGLLVLPDAALDALHAGTITLDVATALIPIAEHVELVEQLVARPGLSVWQIESAHRD
jgi:hypothetical protein